KGPRPKRPEPPRPKRQLGNREEHSVVDGRIGCAKLKRGGIAVAGSRYEARRGRIEDDRRPMGTVKPQSIHVEPARPPRNSRNPTTSSRWGMNRCFWDRNPSTYERRLDRFGPPWMPAPTKAPTQVKHR